jgi:hypothetical protein
MDGMRVAFEILEMAYNGYELQWPAAYLGPRPGGRRRFSSLDDLLAWLPVQRVVPRDVIGTGQLGVASARGFAPRKAAIEAAQLRSAAANLGPELDPALIAAREAEKAVAEKIFADSAGELSTLLDENTSRIARVTAYAGFRLPTWIGDSLSLLALAAFMTAELCFAHLIEQDEQRAACDGDAHPLSHYICTRGTAAMARLAAGYGLSFVLTDSRG